MPLLGRSQRQKVTLFEKLTLPRKWVKWASLSDFGDVTPSRTVLRPWNRVSEHFWVLLPVSFKQRGVQPSKPLFSSTNSLKSPLKIDLKPKTTFVAEIGNFCCFLATRTSKFPDRNFWHWDPPGAEKTRLFRKKVDFFDLTEYSALFEGGAQWQKFLSDPQFFDFYHFSAFL